MEENKKLIVRDWLAIERTKLANERTFLSYFRTAFVLFGTGLGIFKIDIFTDVKFIGIALMIIAPIVLIFGIIRFFKVKKGIFRYYQ